jgi:hypothetical protein
VHNLLGTVEEESKFGGTDDFLELESLIHFSWEP